MSSHNRRQVLQDVPARDTCHHCRAEFKFQKKCCVLRKKATSHLKSNVATSRLSGELSSYLDGRLAERTSVHGVLMDIYGMGVLIQGDSGIGKSETGV